MATLTIPQRFSAGSTPVYAPNNATLVQNFFSVFVLDSPTFTNDGVEVTIGQSFPSTSQTTFTATYPPGATDYDGFVYVEDVANLQLGRAEWKNPPNSSGTANGDWLTGGINPPRPNFIKWEEATGANVFTLRLIPSINVFGMVVESRRFAGRAELSIDGGATVLQTQTYPRQSSSVAFATIVFSVPYSTIDFSFYDSIYVRAVDENGLRSSWVKINFKARPSIAAMLLKSHTLLTAIATTASTPSVLVQRQGVPSEAVTTLSTIATAQRPVLVRERINGRVSNNYWLATQSPTTSGVELRRSRDGGKTWTPMNAPFSSTRIDYFDFVATSDGFAAIAVIKTDSGNNLVFKRVPQNGTWPADTDAATVRAGVTNKPYRLAVSDGGTVLAISDANGLWSEPIGGGSSWT